MDNRAFLKEKKRIVIKIGSSSLTHEETGKINYEKMEKLVRQIADLKNSNKDIVLVTSGAQAVGRSILKLNDDISRLAYKQATAAVGQASLIMKYQKLFREYDHEVAQVLITKDVIEHSQRKANAINTFEALLDLGVIPIVNENDTVATEEIEFGDNDRLSALVSIIIDADLLILLTDIDGLYDANPTNNKDANFISQVNKVDKNILQMAGGTSSKVGTGGMCTKIQAAELVNNHNIDMIIANADTQYVLNKSLAGEDIGTLFKA